MKPIHSPRQDWAAQPNWCSAQNRTSQNFQSQSDTMTMKKKKN